MILIRYSAFKRIWLFLVEKQINSKRLSRPPPPPPPPFHPVIVAKIQIQKNPNLPFKKF